MISRIASSHHYLPRKIILQGNQGNPLIGRIEVQTKGGGLGKMWQLFGEETDVIIGELNEILAA